MVAFIYVLALAEQELPTLYKIDSTGGNNLLSGAYPEVNVFAHYSD